MEKKSDKVGVAEEIAGKNDIFFGKIGPEKDLPNLTTLVSDDHSQRG